jgi:hypothetical protein
VAELVQQDRAEEADRGGQRGQVARRLVVELARELLREPEDRQEQDQEPRRVDPDADAEDAPELE